jgi:hypothetical protein
MTHTYIHTYIQEFGQDVGVDKAIDINSVKKAIDRYVRTVYLRARTNVFQPMSEYISYRDFAHV